MAGQERVLDADAAEQLAVLEILRQQPIGSGEARGLDDERVPERDASPSWSREAFRISDGVITTIGHAPYRSTISGPPR